MLIEIRDDKFVPGTFRLVEVDDGGHGAAKRTTREVGFASVGLARARALELAKSIGDNVSVRSCVEDRVPSVAGGGSVREYTRV